MDIIAAMAVFFITLLCSIYNGISILWPLLLGLIVFLSVALCRGHTIRALYAMMLAGAKKSLLIVVLFILIGAITAVWRASGTIPFIVYHAINFMNAEYFILAAFWLAAAVSFLLGTSFGTASTIGVVLIVLAKSGNIDVNVAAGAIIAGAFFGDRCSPMSSSANLVSVLTGTDLYTNIKNMFKSGWLAFILASAAYIWLSHCYPLTFHDNGIGEDIIRYFDISPATFAPAAIMLLLAALRVDVRLAMLASIVSGSLIAILVQNVEPRQMLSFILTGYDTKENSFFLDIIKGGGLVSMVNVTAIVFISSTYAGIFAGTGLLKEIEIFFVKLAQKIGRFPALVTASFATAAFSCNQTLAVILTHQLFEKIYPPDRSGQHRLALDLENSVILIAALVPWSIAGAVPAAALTADAGFIPYAVYIYLVPLSNLLIRQNHAETNT